MPAAALAQASGVDGGGASLNAFQIPETIVTATRIPTPLGDIPAGVTVITRQMIENRGYTTLVDALSAVPGLRIVQSGGPGANASVFIRGTGSNQVLVLENGVPVNDPANPDGAFNFGSDTLVGVSRIEVIRGPMSSVYGSNAIGGVINIITTPGSGPPEAGVSVAAGLPDASEVETGLSGASGAFDYRLDAGARSQEGFDVTPRRESVYTGERDGFQNQQGSLDLGWTIVPGTRLSLYASGRHSLEGFDTLGSPAFDAPNEVGYSTSALGTLELSSQVLPWWQTVLMASGLYDFRHYLNPLNPADPNQESNNDHYQGTRIDLQWNNTFELPDLGPARDQTATLGFERTTDFANDSLNDSFFGVPFVQATHAEQTSSAWQLGVQSTLWRRLTFSGNLRQDSVSSVGHALTWRAGLVLAVPELWSRFRVSGGTAFRAPSLFDLFGSGSGFEGNPDLKPERSIGFEIGWSTSVPAFGVSDFASLGVTYFHTDVKDLIETQFSPVFTTVNVGLAHLQGVEATLSLQPARWLAANFGYTFTDARDADTGQPLLRRPENLFSANLVLRPWRNITIAPEILYTGAFEDALVDNAGFPAGTGLAPSGTIVNVNTTWQLTPKLAVFLTGNNIFDSKFEPASGFALPGASFLLGARARF